MTEFDYDYFRKLCLNIMDIDSFVMLMDDLLKKEIHFKENVAYLSQLNKFVLQSMLNNSQSSINTIPTKPSIQYMQTWFVLKQKIKKMYDGVPPFKTYTYDFNRAFPKSCWSVKQNFPENSFVFERFNNLQTAAFQSNLMEDKNNLADFCKEREVLYLSGLELRTTSLTTTPPQNNRMSFNDFNEGEIKFLTWCDNQINRNYKALSYGVPFGLKFLIGNELVDEIHRIGCKDFILKINENNGDTSANNIVESINIANNINALNNTDIVKLLFEEVSKIEQKSVHLSAFVCYLLGQKKELRPLYKEFFVSLPVIKMAIPENYKEMNTNWYMINQMAQLWKILGVEYGYGPAATDSSIVLENSNVLSFSKNYDDFFESLFTQQTIQKQHYILGELILSMCSWWASCSKNTSVIKAPPLFRTNDLLNDFVKKKYSLSELCEMIISISAKDGIQLTEALNSIKVLNIDINSKVINFFIDNFKNHQYELYYKQNSYILNCFELISKTLDRELSQTSRPEGRDFLIPG